MALRRRPRAEVLAVAGLAAFVAARHAPNVRRLLRGEEWPVKRGRSRVGQSGDW
jgi:glycerol-3-phosphate acyltransferase PlsY